MKTLDMAFVYSTEGMSGTDRELCEQLWAKTSELLLTKLGNLYRRFEPACEAWGNEINKPYGVILGRSDPKAFLLFYVNARESQEKAVSFHMNGFLGSMEIGEKFDGEGLHGVVLNPKADAQLATSMHLLWHVGMMGGEFYPDAGIYYVPARQSVISDALNEQILKDIGHYALSMVRFYAGDDDVSV